MSSDPVADRIRNEIETSDVVLYMKGTADAPQCGFSGVVVEALRNVGVQFRDVDVLKDPELREGIKKFADWPTIPQLYVKGEFIGGCDIVREMYHSGELHALLKSKGIIAG
ncbi:glutaredoxin-like protein GRLA [Anaplasma marginale str. St. Maries]|uniref:Grx4 family monothiol glutaredoxin n=1 Tax=Anaplasma marginale TaxID=770 RepID=UPI0000497A9C|nr:Grx4 family monothiol glutaredoxin [Anaplasma marginale]AAV86292.1 glutaredoxin-like protein GRLA [Anaplasma marginale str. St. Maries]